MFNNYNIDNSSDWIYSDEKGEKFDYNAFYRAYVASVDDPLRLGRIRVRIPSLHGYPGITSRYLPDVSLPWASPGIQISAGNDIGSYIVPPKGSLVFVTFEYGSTKQLIYFGGIPTKAGLNSKTYNFGPNVLGGEDVEITDNDLIKEYTSQGTQVLYKSPKGAAILMKDIDGKEKLMIIDQSGQFIEMGNLGESLPRRGDSLNPTDTSYISIRRGNGEDAEEIRIENGSITLKANKVNIDAELQQVIYDDDIRLR